jgi:hypothetical protein
MLQEIFPEAARPAYKLETNTWNSYKKYRKFNCKEKTDPKFPLDAGFICSNACWQLHDK